MWRRLRIAALLLALAVTALYAWTDQRRVAAWRDTLWVAVFPLNGDGRPATQHYLDGLGRGDFADIEDFFAREAAAWGVALGRPVRVELQPQIARLPPRLEAGAGRLARLAWSLRVRWYAAREGGGAPADIRVFVLYHDPGHVEAVPHSLGLRKGLLGIVHAYAATAAGATNSLVIAHEVLHTLGATDKYDPATNLPRYPEGYGEPDAEPRHPQAFAEIMAGRVAIGPREAVMPAGLEQALVGRATAAEIGWLRGAP